MVPKTPIEVDVFTGGQILTYEFRDMLKKGEVDAKKGSLEKMTEKSVILQDGTEIEADVVVFGTGFTKHYDLLDRLLQNRLDKEKDGLYLYRNVIPPRLPNIAFVGAEVSTFNNILTHGLQAEWLSRVIELLHHCFTYVIDPMRYTFLCIWKLFEIPIKCLNDHLLNLFSRPGSLITLQPILHSVRQASPV